MKLGKNWRIVIKFQHRHVFDTVELKDKYTGEEDGVYQEDESVESVIPIQVEVDGLMFLDRTWVDEEVVEANIIHEEDDTLLHYCEIGEEHEISYEDSDLDLIKW